jgi:prepilin-type N-terminal cleavage/methylation domain-containing protein
MKKTKFKAFSLIELSIVIIVIGIIIAGVTQGSSLIIKARLNAAKALTQSSPVSAIPGLRLWLETTMEDSFAPDLAFDDSSIQMWYDRNPQVSSKLYAATTSSDIKYKQNSYINSLPSLYFPGTAADFFTVATSVQFTTGTTTPATINATAIPTSNNIFSYFLVVRSEAAGEARNVFHNGSSNGWGYAHTTEDKQVSFSGTLSVTAGATFTKAEIISATYSGGTVSTSNLKLYTDGSLETINVEDATTVATPTTGLYIGSINGTGSATTNWKGYISEIIIFEKKLNDTDRRAVEEYLGKKYNIKVANG